MKHIAIGAALLLSLATPALAEPAAPATTALPTPTPVSPSMDYLRTGGTLPAPPRAKRRALTPMLATPTSLYPLSFQQLQDEQRRQLDEIFHIDHSG